MTELIQIKVKKTTSIQNTKYTHKVKKNKYFFLKLINCSNIERQGKNEVIASLNCLNSTIARFKFLRLQFFLALYYLGAFFKIFLGELKKKYL